MRAIWVVSTNEFKDFWNSGKFVIMMIVVTALMAISSVALLQPYQQRVDRLQRSAGFHRLADPARSPLSAIHFQAFRQPSIMELFNEGIAAEFPSEYSLPRYARVDPTALQSSDLPLFNPLPVSDFRLIFQLIFPLIAIVSSFSLIAGERETGTLALLCSQSIRKWEIYLGKMLAGSILLSSLLLVAHLAPAGVFLLLDVPLPKAFLTFLLFHFSVTLLWTLFFFLFGLCVSAAVATSTQSIILLLVIWALLAVVAPSTVPSLVTSLSNYESESEVYENTWPHHARLFDAVDSLVDGLGYSFVSGMKGYLARQPTTSSIAASLQSKLFDAKLLCHSDGTVILRTSDESVIRKIEHGLPEFLKVQSAAGWAIDSVRRRRYQALHEESERLNRWFGFIPVIAYNQLTSALSLTDSTAYLEFLDQLNRRKELYFEELDTNGQLSSRLFFTRPTGAGGSLGKLPPPVWEYRTGYAQERPLLPAPFLLLFLECTALALVGAVVFQRSDVI